MLWSSEQYQRKAQRYAEMASEAERATWERPFWLSLSLEFLARAALTKIHPALNADPQGDGLNLLYAFGYELKGQPKSLPIHAVFLRLERILEDFNKPRREFCDFFSNARNQELHTAELAFESLSEITWLARFYDVAQVLCTHLGLSLSDLFGSDEAASAEDLIRALHSDKRTTVEKRIAAHRSVFEAKSEEERTALAAQQEAVLRSSFQFLVGRAQCPACGSAARLTGTLERTSRPYYDGDEFLEKSISLANSFSCSACGLKLSDVDELHVAGIEPHFEKVSAAELHDYHEPDYGPEYDNM